MKYLEYLLYVKCRDSSSYNGIEYYVDRCLKKNSTDFLPGINTVFLADESSNNKVDNKEEIAAREFQMIVK